MSTTWGYYGKKGGRGDVMRPILSKEEQEKMVKALIFERLAIMKALGIKTKAQLAREQEALDNSAGVCPTCHMQRSITGVCSC